MSKETELRKAQKAAGQRNLQAIRDLEQARQVAKEKADGLDRQASELQSQVTVLQKRLSFEGAVTAPSTAKVALRVISIATSNDGSYRKTRWTFDIYADGARAVAIPSDVYWDKAAPYPGATQGG
jgi:hypothetical protein